MKITFDIECTAKEARQFLGLPDVEPLQQEMMDKIREQMLAGAAGFDPASLMRPFMPEHLQSMEAMQRAFWENFTGNSGSGKRDKG